MPKKTRDYLLRRHDQAQGALDRAVYHLTKMMETYGERAPNHRDACGVLVLQIAQLKDFLRQFRVNHM